MGSIVSNPYSAVHCQSGIYDKIGCLLLLLNAVWRICYARFPGTILEKLLGP
jgi:hypothetical protein